MLLQGWLASNTVHSQLTIISAAEDHFSVLTYTKNKN